MSNIVDLTYAQTGESTKLNSQGMREMQERVYNARAAQYLLVKAPPASGKSRALMYVGLDKIRHQGLRKIIVAVPERVIAKSFDPVDLTQHGFFANWSPKNEYNLCIAGGEKGKVQTIIRFLDSEEQILICTHSSLRFAFDSLGVEKFNEVFLAIDEFHHVSADSESRLGELVRAIMNHTNAHIMAMTGSYFRGDSIPVLMPADEAKFTKVVYTYYEQLNGYSYLKSLGIGYHFYQGRYMTAISQVLNTDKKTILHIPSVQSGESTKDKRNEVDAILDAIGTVLKIDRETGVIFVERKEDQKTIKVADLVNDIPSEREKIIRFLRQIEERDEVDLIIALGMAKEGFDWPFCEHALTIGYRGSLTEIVQIIGRCTRDSQGKSHAQFTNLIAQPDVEDDQVRLAVNNMLKAISCSLLMEQVLAPNFKFLTKLFDNDAAKAGEIKIRGFRQPSSARVKDIVEFDLNELKAAILQDNSILNTIIHDNSESKSQNQILIPKIIKSKYPDLSDIEIEEVRQHVITDSVFKNSEIKEVGNQKFIKLAKGFVNIDELHIDLIDQVNPFQEAYEIISKLFTTSMLKMILEAITETKISMSLEEVKDLWDKAKAFKREVGRDPCLTSSDPSERRIAEAIVFIKQQRRIQKV